MTAAIGYLRGGLRGTLVLLGVAVSIGLAAYLSAVPSEFRAAVALALVLAAVAVGIVWPERLLYGLIAWLVVLGLVRRLLTLVAPSTGHDPLLLVEPAAAALLLIVVVERKRLPPRTALSGAVAAMTMIIALSGLNPAQGGITVGLAGLLFLLVPMIGFWVGRVLCIDDVFARILKLVAALAIPVAIYGLIQTFVGFPHWDERWILEVGQSYQALNVGTVTRAFGSLPSSAEYAYVLAVGLAVWLAFGLRGLRLPMTGLVVVLLATALVLESVRLVIFLSAAALIAMLVGRLRTTAPVAAVIVLLSFLGTSTLVGRLAPEYYTPGTTGALLSHQLQGLSNPLSSKQSTFFIHLSLVTEGLSSAKAHPAGLGAGTVSLAADKFGGLARASEADPSNLAIAAGIPGLVTYLVLAVLAFVRAYDLARTRRDAISLSALAVVTIVFLEWFNGGQYGIALLLWITLGWIDRSWAALDASRRAARDELGTAT